MIISCLILIYVIFTEKQENGKRYAWKVTMLFVESNFISIPKNKLYHFPLKVIPMSLMRFLILLNLLSMHCWKDSSQIPLRFGRYGPLDFLHALKRRVWTIEQRDTEQDQINRKLVSIQGCSSWKETARFTGR